MSEEIQLDEVFDENTSTYPVINLKPQLKVPQIWKFDVPGNDSLMARMVSFQSDGDAVKNVKMGDKFVQLFIMSLSDKGNTGELRGGLGSDPIGAVTTIFDTIVDSAKRYRFDAVLFRLPIKKMKGQGPAVQRLIARLAMSRGGGKYVVLKELWDYSSKYAYVLIRRKNVKLEDIPGIPAVSTELFTAVETKVGTTYVEKKSGRPVTKDEAFAASIAELEDNRTTDRAIAARTKISRRDAIMAQYSIPVEVAGNKIDTWSREAIDTRDKLNTAPPVHQASGEENREIYQIARASVVGTKDSVEDGLTDIEMFYDGDEEDKLNASPQFKDFRANLRRLTSDFNKSAALKTPRTETEIDQMVSNAQRQYFNIISDFNGKNHLDIFKKLAGLIVDTYEGYELMPYQREQFVKWIVTQFNDDVYRSVSTQYKLISESYSPVSEDSIEAKAINIYCSAGYSEINSYLIGEDAGAAVVRDKYIPALDKAFESGITLPKGTPLYRGMAIKSSDFQKAIDNKIFYFTNFVSTSLVPAFVGMYGNTVDVLNKDIGTESDLDSTDPDSEELVSKYSGPFNIKVGMCISGADKIKVIFPGKLTKYTDECEIILPRGTAVRLNKAWTKSVNEPNGGSRSALIESTVIPLDQINEGTEVYDGDALITEGTVKRLDFSRFLKETAEEDEFFPEPVDPETRSKSIADSSPEMDVLLDLITFDNFSDKFIN